jgi:hypothetical protein
MINTARTIYLKQYVAYVSLQIQGSHKTDIQILVFLYVSKNICFYFNIYACRIIVNRGPVHTNLLLVALHTLSPLPVPPPCS